MTQARLLSGRYRLGLEALSGHWTPGNKEDFCAPFLKVGEHLPSQLSLPFRDQNRAHHLQPQVPARPSSHGGPSEAVPGHRHGAVLAGLKHHVSSHICCPSGGGSGASEFV